MHILITFNYSNTVLYKLIKILIFKIYSKDIFVPCEGSRNKNMHLRVWGSNTTHLIATCNVRPACGSILTRVNPKPRPPTTHQKATSRSCSSLLLLLLGPTPSPFLFHCFLLQFFFVNQHRIIQFSSIIIISSYHDKPISPIFLLYIPR